jgi:NAD(P) transhydrogenase subunit beta
MTYVVQIAYLVATALFIFSLHWMSNPKTARRGVFAGVAAMLIAVVFTWLQPEVVKHGWVLGAIILGFVVGYPLAQVPLTAVPQRTAFSHAFGGLAAGIVGASEFYFWLQHEPGNLNAYRMVAIVAEVILGFLTLTGSLMACGKLMELKWPPQRPWTYRGQIYVNLGTLTAAVIIGLILIISPAGPAAGYLFPFIIVLSLAFGVMLVLPIGGADMPTVISILNSYAGLSAVAMGFVLDNKLLITAGALDGSSGLILSIIMCRAMNRSFTNVLFGAFGQVHASAATSEERIVRSATPEEAAPILANAGLVIVVPGYGMAVAQAQHKVRELFDTLTKLGVEVRFAIHPVAGRMPGHMNVLLAEADIPYDRMFAMDEINSDFSQADVALVIGANDVTNPAARHDTASPIYGMPILDVDKARTVMVIKRGMSPGFAGIDNELYYLDRTLMVFGDAKSVVGNLVKEIAAGNGMH